MNRVKKMMVSAMVFVWVLAAMALDQTPSAFLGSGYTFQTSTTNGVVTNLSAGVDYLCIPRTNVSANLTAAMCTNDVRSMAYYFVMKIHGVIDAQPVTNRFTRLTVSTGNMNGLGYSNLIQRVMQQTFLLDGSQLAPAAE
jgi:hypothetical protein